MKKRENSRIDPNDPFSDTRARFHGAPTSETKEIDRRKKVKFDAPENVSPRNFTLESKREMVTKTCVDADAKTSEYAFFKKFKKDASLRSRSGPLRNNACLSSKKHRSSDCSREKTSDARVGSKSYNSPRIIEDMSTVKRDSFLSPPGGNWNKSDLYFISNKPKGSQGRGDTSIPQGNQYVHGEIFSRKRQKLRQCVTDALSSDTEKLCSKGHDIVSMLLSRLFPVSTEGNKYEVPNPGKVVNTRRYDLPDSRESDVQFEEHYQIPKRKLLELESSSYFGDHTESDVFKEHYQIPKRKLLELESSSYFSGHTESDVQFKEHYQLPQRKLLEHESSSYFCDHNESDDQFKEHYQIPQRKLLELESSSYFSNHTESAVQFKDHYHLPKRKLLELKSNSYSSDHFLSPIFLRPNERITPHTEFPTYHSHDFEPLYGITEPGCKLSRIPSFSATAMSGVTLGSLFNEVANATRDVQFTEHHQIPNEKFLELESSSYSSNHLLSPIFLRSVGMITPRADFPTYPHRFRTLLSITEAGSQFGRTPSFIDKSDVTRGFLCGEQKHDTFTLNHFNETGTLEHEPSPLLLENNFDCTSDEINLPVAHKYTESDNAPALSVLDQGEEQILGNTSDKYNFSPSFSLLNKPRENINSVFDSSLLRYQEFRFGKYVYEDFDTNFDQTALSLSNNKHYFKFPENCKNDISCVQDSMHLSPYQHWVRRTVSSDHHQHPDSEAWPLSSLNEYQRCLPLTSYCSNYQGSNSRTLQLPKRESISSLFHTNNNYEPEMDGGNEGEVLYHFSEGFVEIYNSSFLRMSMQRDPGCPFGLDGGDYINEKE